MPGKKIGFRQGTTSQPAEKLLFRRSELQLRRNVRAFNGLSAPEETLLALFRSLFSR
jgi:hypothetical protein